MCLVRNHSCSIPSIHLYYRDCYFKRSVLDSTMRPQTPYVCSAHGENMRDKLPAPNDFFLKRSRANALFFFYLYSPLPPPGPLRNNIRRYPDTRARYTTRTPRNAFAVNLRWWSPTCTIRAHGGASRCGRTAVGSRTLRWSCIGVAAPCPRARCARHSIRLIMPGLGFAARRGEVVEWRKATKSKSQRVACPAFLRDRWGEGLMYNIRVRVYGRSVDFRRERSAAEVCRGVA